MLHHFTCSFSGASERRLAFQNGVTRGSDMAPEAASLQEMPEDLLRVKLDITSDVIEKRGRAIDALHELVRAQLGNQREDISREQKERVGQTIAFAREELERYGNQGEQERIAAIETKFNRLGNPEGQPQPASEEQEDAAFSSDPMKWFREKGAEVWQIFKKASSPAEWLKGIAAIAAMIGTGWEKLKDYVASAIGPTIASLKEVPLVGGMFTGIEKFIGERRKALFAALSYAGIELPLAVASHARRALDQIERELSAAAKGWGADRLAGEFAKLLKDAGIFGERARNATTAQIDEWIQKLRDEVSGTQKPEVAKAALDDFGLAGRRDGEAKEIGDNGIEFKDLSADNNAYSIGTNEIKIGQNTYNVTTKNKNSGEDLNVQILFEPHIDGTTLVNTSKVIYKHAVGMTTETVSVALSEIESLAEGSKSRTSGSLEVGFTKK